MCVRASRRCTYARCALCACAYLKDLSKAQTAPGCDRRRFALRSAIRVTHTASGDTSLRIERVTTRRTCCNPMYVCGPCAWRDPCVRVGSAARHVLANVHVVRRVRETASVRSRLAERLFDVCASECAHARVCATFGRMTDARLRVWTCAHVQAQSFEAIRRQRRHAEVKRRVRQAAAHLHQRTCVIRVCGVIRASSRSIRVGVQ